jgi:ADP-ribose pyrophosphatase YjhB (NUDIX family)
MRSEYRYCPKCAGPLQVRFTEGCERQVCSKCGFVFYQNPVPAAAVIMQREAEILLVQRKFEPRIGDWSLPAGFVEWGESADETAVREAKEETGLDIAVGGLYGVYAARDYWDYQVLLVVYRAEILGGELKAGDDALDARFFNFSALPPNIAFRIHHNILAALAKDKNLSVD